MSERYMTLMGAEQVQSAGVTMRGAADEMRRAGGAMDEAARSIARSVIELRDVLSAHETFMREWLERLAVVIRTNGGAV